MTHSLIELLEAATGPDRDLDARLAVLCGDVVMQESQLGISFFESPVKAGDWAFLGGCKQGEDDAFRSLGGCLTTKPYTASVDAALDFAERLFPKPERRDDVFPHAQNWPDIVSDALNYLHLVDAPDMPRERFPIAILIATLKAKDKSNG